MQHKINLDEKQRPILIFTFYKICACIPCTITLKLVNLNYRKHIYLCNNLHPFLEYVKIIVKYRNYT